MSELRGIPEPGPIGEGRGDAGADWSRRRGQRDGERTQSRLIKGEDRVTLSPPAEGALAIFRDCVLRSVEQELALGGRERSAFPGTDGEVEPRQAADHLCAELGALLQKARSEARLQADNRLLSAARRGTEDAVSLLGQLGLLDGVGGESVSALLEGWAERLDRLVGQG
ncbi:MAG: hypothetical protein R3F30_02385 [Planctomycetota bacterium]